MESTFTIMSIAFIAFGILQIILFFKLWAMTNDVREIKNKYLNEIMKIQENTIEIPTKRTTEITERQVAHDKNDLILKKSMLAKVGENQCLVFVIANSKFEIWEKETWENTITEDNEDLFELIR